MFEFKTHDSWAAERSHVAAADVLSKRVLLQRQLRFCVFISKTSKQRIAILLLGSSPSFASPTIYLQLQEKLDEEQVFRVMISERNATLTLHSRRKLEGGFYETCRTRFYSPSTWKSLPAQFEIPRLVLRAGLKAMQFVSDPRPKENTIASVVRAPPSRQASFRVQRTQINGGAGPHLRLSNADGRTRRAAQMVCVRAGKLHSALAVLGTRGLTLAAVSSSRSLRQRPSGKGQNTARPYGTSVCSAHFRNDPVCRAFRMHRKMKILQIFENILSWTSKREYSYIATYHSDMLAGVSPQSFVCGLQLSASVRIWNPAAGVS
ncbi:Hypothetical_protein [Hexamita inflata]|uniref:Hypothetical_protein n=1 Tax=Hexamita inflata TaxID=28002 RepID=A0AA86NLR6_9EUKA|nr:Hypothetical protein HINF_LOCUS9041 [Hexamita inflata]